jgi:hypothetical protein
VFAYSPRLVIRSFPRRTMSLGVALASLIALPLSSAQAAVATSKCQASSLSQPFLKWGDPNLYKLVAGGDFEGSLSGWTLSHGAQKVSVSEPYAATGALGSSSMLLSAGASVQTPFTCVDASDPTFRFFARNNGGASSLLVQVVYQSHNVVVAVPVGTVTLNGGWQPTQTLLTGSAIASLFSGGSAQMALRFTAATGSSNIDDVYIDPRMN